MVHGSVSDHNSGVLDAARTSGGDRLLEDHTVSDEGVSEGATGLLDDLNVVQVAATLKSKDGLYSKLNESFTVMEQKLGGKSGHGDVSQILLELGLILRVVHGNFFQNLLSGIASKSPSLNDNLGVNFLVYKLLSLLEELSGQYSDSSGTITDLFVLGHGDIDKNLGGWVVDID